MSAIPKISSAETSFRHPAFEERHRRQRSFLNDVSQMSDEDIVNASIRNANEKTKNSTAASVLQKGPFLVYAATSIVSGALTKGGLSNKLAATAGSLALFGVLNGAIKPVDSAVDSFMNIGSKDSDRCENHPVLNAALNIAALAGVGVLAVKGASAGTKKLAEKFAPTAKQITEKLADGAKKLDNSKLGKHAANFSKKAAEFSAKYPKVSSLLKTSALYAPIAGVMGASIPLSNKLIEKRNETAMENAAKLVLCRDTAAEALEEEDI